MARTLSQASPMGSQPMVTDSPHYFLCFKAFGWALLFTQADELPPLQIISRSHFKLGVFNHYCMYLHPKITAMYLLY